MPPSRTTECCLASSFPQWGPCSACPSALPMVSRQASHGLLSWGAQTMSHWMSTSCPLPSPCQEGSLPAQS